MAASSARRIVRRAAVRGAPLLLKNPTSRESIPALARTHPAPQDPREPAPPHAIATSLRDIPPGAPHRGEASAPTAHDGRFPANRERHPPALAAPAESDRKAPGEPLWINRPRSKTGRRR